MGERNGLGRRVVFALCVLALPTRLLRIDYARTPPTTDVRRARAGRTRPATPSLGTPIVILYLTVEENSSS